MRTLILFVVLTSVALAQSDPPRRSWPRALYAPADYRGALDMLERLATAKPSPPDRQSIDLYRTFCLVALGRAAEADEAVAAMITRDPLYRPADSEIPPRLRSLFRNKRRLVLPTIIQSKYERAKEAFDRNEYKRAAEGFTEVLIALSDADIAAQARKPPLSDLRVLAIGFNDLAVRAMTPEPASQLPAPRQPPRTELRTALREAPAIAHRMPAIDDSTNADVVAPVSLHQDIPDFHRAITADRNGVLVVVIDEAGRVESAIITQPLDSYYDSLLLQAAKRWRYEPAMRDGVAVKYRNSIQLILSQTN